MGPESFMATNFSSCYSYRVFFSGKIASRIAPGILSRVYNYVYFYGILFVEEAI